LLGSLDCAWAGLANRLDRFARFPAECWGAKVTISPSPGANSRVFEAPTLHFTRFKSNDGISRELICSRLLALKSLDFIRHKRMKAVLSAVLALTLHFKNMRRQRFELHSVRMQAANPTVAPLTSQRANL
jgi:hypothetical protein